MRKKGCRAMLTFTFLTLAIEHKFVSEKKIEKIIPFLGIIKIRFRSTHCIYIELRFLNVKLMTLLYIFP